MNMSDSKISVYDAAYKGDYDFVKDSLEKDKDLIKKRDSNERKLIHWVALSGNVKLLWYLIEYGTEIDPEDDTSTTPLILAASANRPKIVELLLGKGAYINQQSNNGHSALQYACSKGLTEVCNILLENGADINIEDKRGATPLHRAASKGNLEIIKLLLQHRDKLILNIHDASGNTPLHLACEEDRQEVAGLLYKNGASLEEQNAEGKTPLNLCTKGLKNYLSKITPRSVLSLD